MYLLLYIYSITHSFRKSKGGATMFFKLIFENANGYRVDMTATTNQYIILWVEGLNPPQCH